VTYNSRPTAAARRTALLLFGGGLNCNFSAEYLKAKMTAVDKISAELINGMIRREMALTE
jgi:hypothetical protein